MHGESAPDDRARGARPVAELVPGVREVGIVLQQLDACLGDLRTIAGTAEGDLLQALQQRLVQHVACPV
eukprot:1329417-Lingulodinium_polyedra.AAC.1